MEEKHSDVLDVMDESYEEGEYNEFGIFYRIKDKYISDKHELFIDVAYDKKSCKFYVGIYIDKKGQGTEPLKYKSIIKRDTIINGDNGDYEYSEHYIAWKNFEDDCQPNFKVHDEIFYSLPEEESFNKFIDGAMITIDELIGDIGFD